MKKVILLIVVMLVSSLSVSLVSAGELPPEGEPCIECPPPPCLECLNELDNLNAVATCDSVSISYNSSLGNNSMVLGITTQSELALLQTFESANVSTTIPFVAPLPAGEQVLIFVGIFSSAESESQEEIGVTVVQIPACDSEPPFIEQCADGRLNENQCEPLAIYPVTSEDGIGLNIYEINRGSDVGVFQLYVDAERLSSLSATDQACTVDASADGSIVVYLLPSGEVQINAGPDDDNKVFVYRFDSLPGTPEIETYSAVTTPEILPACS